MKYCSKATKCLCEDMSKFQFGIKAVIESEMKLQEKALGEKFFFSSECIEIREMHVERTHIIKSKTEIYG